jgi:hypothetical protein
MIVLAKTSSGIECPTSMVYQELLYRKEGNEKVE